MRDLKLSLEMATKWYNGQDSELKELAVQTYPELVKKELPKSWDELGHIITSFATNEQVLAVDAMRKLSQLMAVYNDGWVPNYADGKNKYIIFFHDEKVIIAALYRTRSFLIFKNQATAELFLENFSDLILTAKPLLS
jgi:hypothetical protein